MCEKPQPMLSSVIIYSNCETKIYFPFILVVDRLFIYDVIGHWCEKVENLIRLDEYDMTSFLPIGEYNYICFQI